MTMFLNVYKTNGRFSAGGLFVDSKMAEKLGSMSVNYVCTSAVEIPEQPDSTESETTWPHSQQVTMSTAMNT